MQGMPNKEKEENAIKLLYKTNDIIESNDRIDNQENYFDEYGNYSFPTEFHLNDNTMYGSSEGFAYINRFMKN